MKSVGMTEPKQMATIIALGGIATALWFESESFSSWMELEDAFKKTWCSKLNPSDAKLGLVRPTKRRMGILGNILSN